MNLTAKIKTLLLRYGLGALLAMAAGFVVLFSETLGSRIINKSYEPRRHRQQRANPIADEAGFNFSGEVHRLFCGGRMGKCKTITSALTRHSPEYSTVRL